MEQLITIEQREGKQTVNARELHAFLEVGRDFSSWIKQRIEKYDFIDGEDFSPVLVKSITGRPATEYRLSIHMAKEIAMVENNEQGKKARRYFIEVEKQYKKELSLPSSFSEALQLAADQARKIEQQEAELLTARPAVQFYNDVTGSKDAIEMGQVAKIIDCGIGRNKLFELLRANGILRENNEPYQEYIDKGWFRVVEQKYNKPDGSIAISIKTLVYQKGVDGINRLARRN